jgi:hypothetical protein
MALVVRNVFGVAWWLAYLGVVLNAACDDWVDGELSLLIQG